MLLFKKNIGDDKTLSKEKQLRLKEDKMKQFFYVLGQKDETEKQRLIKYIIDNDLTVRQAEKCCDCSKTVIHNILKSDINGCKLLQRHKKERAKKGGLALKRKKEEYLAKKRKQII